MCLAETVSSPDRIRAFCRVAHWREMAQLEALVGEATAEECDLEAALFGETDARVIAGMLEFVFVRDGTGGSMLALVTVSLVIFAVDIPVLFAFSVARFQPGRPTS